MGKFIQAGFPWWAALAAIVAVAGCSSGGDGGDAAGVAGAVAPVAGAGAGVPQAGVAAAPAPTAGLGTGVAGAVPGTGGADPMLGTGGMMGLAGAMDTAGMPVDTGGAMAGMEPVAGMDVGVAGMDPAGGAPADPPMPMGSGCTPPPPGTFSTTTSTGGPGGNYTIVRPSTLGEGGFLHPPVAWGNGLGTTPPLYAGSLDNLASQGFVVIGNPGPGSDPQVVRAGLEWLIEQNGSGEFAGKLAVDCAATIGYSMGGGAAIGSGSHPAVKAIVSIHGLQDATERASGAILLLTAEGDTFVTKSGFVAPAYTRSSVQPTILASHSGGDHLDPLNVAAEDWAPAVAWLRLWLYGDESGRNMFFGDNCTLCSWPDFRRKNHPEWD